MHGVDQAALLTADRFGRQIARPAEVLVRECQPIFGGRDVGGDRGQRGGIEFVVQLGHSLFRRVDACGQVDDLLGQGVEARRCVDHQVAHLLESLPLRFQFAIGPRRGDDHLGQQLAPLLPGFRYRIVELLTHGKSLGQSGFGVVYRAVEWLGALLAELLDRQRQLVGAGAHRIVDVDDFPSGQVVESAQRQCRQCIGVGGVDTFGRGQLGRPAPTMPVTHDHIQGHHRDQDHAQPDQQRRRTRRRRTPVEPVGCRDSRCAPVAATQRGFDLVAPQIVDLAGADRPDPIRHQERIRVVDRRHREHSVEVAQVAGGTGALRPADGRLSGEVVDEDHPQLDAAIGVELAGGRLDGGAAGTVECPGVVGDVSGQPERWLCCGRRRHQQSGHQHRHQHGDRADSTHARQCNPLRGA